MDIRITKTQSPKTKPQDENALGFGRIYTDHMFLMHYDEQNGWHNAEIVPYAPFSLEPASIVLHYAQECFEGMKAYRRPDGGVQLFRPDKNAARMASTHRRLCIPEIPEKDFVQAVAALTSIDKGWVPSAPGTSLYLRPCTIATEAHLGVKPSEKYLFFIIASPSGPYYAEGLDPVSIYVEEEYTRAAPGGTGAVKCGGNYAASLAGQIKAQEKGCSQVLWLDGAERKYVEEVGSMNCFFKIGNDIYTAPTDAGTVLPGITRLSCIELLQGWGYNIKEEKIAIDNIMSAAHSGKLVEVFGTGTAAVVSPVGQLVYKDESVEIGGGKTGELTARLYKALTDIQWGIAPDEKGWTVPVE